MNRSPLPWREFFALDARSLALFRVCIAVQLLIDWLDRLPDLASMFTDAGILPRHAISGGIPVSVMMLSGSLWWQWLVSLLALAFGGMLLVGWKTPLATFASFVLLISAHGRNPWVMHGADHLLRCLLFWGIFLPLGACWSVDARTREQRPASPFVLSIASFAFIGQLAMVYLFAAAWKWEAEWRQNNDAVYLALNLDSFATRFGQWLRGYPDLCRLATVGSLYLETLGPAILLLPFHVGMQRLVTVFLFCMFHGGLALSMELSLFPFIACAGWLALLPGSFWDRLALKLPRLRVEWGTAAEADWTPPRGLVPAAFVALCFAYVALSNTRGLAEDYLNRTGRPLAEEEKSAFTRFMEDHFPPQLQQFGMVTGLEQGWGVFAPRPSRYGGWTLAVATLANGDRTELIFGGDPDDRAQPEQQQATYWNGRWRKLMNNMPLTAMFPDLIKGWTLWKVREWEKAHGRARRIVRIEFLWMKKPNDPPGTPTRPVAEETLGTWEEPKR
ncbi:MAG: HTTM domain-containing protein [Gemmataceae bacterium]|nr:HTTM domain-containing protein [Gemmataceae bacterium]